MLVDMVVMVGMVVLVVSLAQVSLWKETLDEQWQCISDVSKGSAAAQG